MNQKEQKTYLNVGLDESNHITEYNNPGEIVVATFSHSCKDSVYRAYSGKRGDKELKGLKAWMQNQDNTKDYRFTL